MSRAAAYEKQFENIRLILEEEDDWIAAMATVACELHNAFEHYHWTGFYRAVSADLQMRCRSLRPCSFAVHSADGI